MIIMKIQNIGFLILFLILMATVEFIDEVWLSKISFKNTEVFPPWIARPDSVIFILINQSISNPVLDLIMSLITHFGSTIFWLTFSFLLWFTGRRKEALILATAIILGGIIALFLKVYVARPRPYKVIAETRILEKEGGFSFPSGHAKNVFSAAVILGKDRGKKAKSLLYIFALIISFSRIYVGVHYPLDVLTGAFLGYIIGKIILLYEKQIILLIKKFTSIKI